MRKFMLMFLLVCSSAQGQELSYHNGKGVQHNPDTDSSVIMLRFSPESVGPFQSYTEAGVSAATVTGNYGRAYTSIHLGKQLEYTAGVFFANVSLGAAGLSRTNDGPEFALAPYGSFFVGIRHKGISAGFGQWMVYNPGLHYRWACTGGTGTDQCGDGFHEQGERWISPAFTGFRLSIDIDVKRRTHD